MKVKRYNCKIYGRTMRVINLKNVVGLEYRNNYYRRLLNHIHRGFIDLILKNIYTSNFDRHRAITNYSIVSSDCIGGGGF